MGSMVYDLVTRLDNLSLAPLPLRWPGAIVLAVEDEDRYVCVAQLERHVVHTLQLTDNTNQLLSAVARNLNLLNCSSTLSDRMSFTLAVECI